MMRLYTGGLKFCNADLALKGKENAETPTPFKGGMNVLPFPAKSIYADYTYNVLPKGYQSSGTSVHFMNYHFVWTPKYRRKVITGSIEQRLKVLLKEKCTVLGIEILSLQTMPDHTHIFLRAAPTIAPNRIIAALKGYSSRILRLEFPELRTKLPTLWSRSYFVSTHGHVSNETIEKYIEEQKTK
jgi:putative transposase